MGVLFSSQPGVSFYKCKWYNLTMKKILSIILTIALLFSFTACGNKENASAKPSERNIEVSEATLRKWLDESVGMWEFAQRFFDDTIIYKTKLGTWAFAPVDTSLPQSDYNWDYLRHAGPIANTEWEYYEDGDLKSIKGIDLSNYNVVDDWEAVKDSGVKFVMLRIGYRGYTKGGLVEDKKFFEYARAAAKQGLELGTYFVTQAITVEEAIEEANYAAAMMKKAGVDFSYPVALDLEDAGSLDARTANLSKSERTEIIKAFCERLKELGYTPMLYSAIRWYMDEMDLSQLTEYDKWFAQYFNRPFFPYEFQIWQYTSSGVVDGIQGNVDLNICFKDYSKE